MGGGITWYFREYLDYLLPDLIDHYIIGYGEEPVLSFMSGDKMPALIIEDKMLKVDGRPFFPEEIVDKINSVLNKKHCIFYKK